MSHVGPVPGTADVRKHAGVEKPFLTGPGGDHLLGHLRQEAQDLDRALLQRSRAALDFVYRQFLRDPARRWPWLAHAALIAKHRLKDLPLARMYARALEQHTARVPLPLWARQMEIFILEDMNELEAARIMIASWLQSGQLDDPAELRFLKQRLEELEARIGAK